MTEYLTELNAARAALGQQPWHYNGDQDIAYGGFYWTVDETFDDYASVVEVVPCSDAGGPDNKFSIEIGSIYFAADKLESALSVIGVKPGEETLEDKVYAFKAYHGIDRDHIETIIEIGEPEDDRPNGWNPETTYTLEDGTDLRKYVEENYLN